MHGYRGFAEHRLGPCRCDHDERRGILWIECLSLDLIALEPELAFGLHLNDFEIGNGGQQLRVPVDQPLVLVDEPFAMKFYKNFKNGPRQPLVHGKAFARPVAGRTKTFELVDDGAAALGLPFPYALEEGFAPHLAAALLLPLHELALDHHLRCDAGMVCARLPEHVLAAHALEAAQNVLE